MVDVPVGQIALAEVMLGVVAVQIELGRQKIRRCIAPCTLPLDGRNVILNGVHQIINVVVAAEILVHIIGDQLDRQVAGDTAHAHQAAVHSQIAAQVLIQKLLRQTEAQGHVLMQVQRQADVRGQIVVRHADDALQIAAAHAAEGIHDGELPRVDGVDLLKYPEQIFIAVAHDVDGVDGDLVAQFFNAAGKVHAVFNVVIVRGDADDFDAVSIVGGQLFDVVVGAHRHAGVHRAAALALVRQQAVQLLNGVADRDIGVVAVHIAQKAHLDHINARAGQRLDDAPCLPEAPLPVIDIAAVAQGAVQQFDISHGASPSKFHLPAPNL